MKRGWFALSVASALAGAVGIAHAAAPATPPAPAQTPASAPTPPASMSAPPATDAGPPSLDGSALLAAPAPPAPMVAPADTDQRMDVGLEELRAGHHATAAAAFFGVYNQLPLGDSRRDLASYHLATALAAMSFTQAAVEHYLEILSGRRAPELMGKTLAALKPLYEKRQVDEWRLVEGVLYGHQFNDIAPDVADLVEYLQALTDIRHGFTAWGRGRLEALAHTNRPYSFSAKYALAALRVELHEDDPAAEELRAIIASTAEIPFEIRNQARTALGRILYEKKLYEDAWKVYSEVDSPLPLQDVVMIERAWDRVASGDQSRALGLLVGLGAPVFHSLFSPERYLIRGLALRRLCQYRAAHVAVRDFRAHYGAAIEKIKRRASLSDDPTIRSWAIAGTTALRDSGRIQDLLARERNALGKISDDALNSHLQAIYANQTAGVTRTLDREMEKATEVVADELLRIDEQMSLIEYEIGAGLFKSGGEGKTGSTSRSTDVPLGSDEVFFKFDGEYWSDELGSFEVLAEDRCVR